MRLKKTVSSCLAALVAVAPAAAQNFQIRTRVDLVVVPLTVKAGNGELVTGLGADDFTVWEDGVEQSVERFSIDPVPLSAAVVIDTGIDGEALTAIKDSIPAIVFGFGPLDEVAVFRYDNQVVKLQDFTDDPDLLRTSLDQLKMLRPKPEFIEGGPVQDGPVINGVPAITTARRPRTRESRLMHDAVYQAALALRNRPEERRKILVLISDGSDARSEQRMDDNILFLLTYEIQVYSIGLGIPLLERLVNQVNDRLDNYARLTGGDFYQARTSALEHVFPHVTEQARNQYVLTYISSNPLPTDRIAFRRIEVFSNNPSWDVVHRAGYYQTP